jgi:hypothetical protein
LAWFDVTFASQDHACASEFLERLSRSARAGVDVLDAHLPAAGFRDMALVQVKISAGLADLHCLHEWHVWSSIGFVMRRFYTGIPLQSSGQLVL